MKNIFDVIIENGEDAKNILKSIGGKIYFVDGLADCDDEDEFMSNLDEESEIPDIPIVLVGYDSIVEAYVCAMRLDENENIEFLLYDFNSKSVMWDYAASCCYYSENFAYEYLEQFYFTENK